LERSEEVSKIHQNVFSSELIVRTVDHEQHENDFSDSDKDIELLRKDEVADVAADFGALGTTIESLSQLKAMPGARAELAMLSLSRGYVSNCISRNGKWTSGLHLYWWSKKRLDSTPDVGVEDLRSVGAIQLARQSTLTAWSLMMLRLTFIEDITVYAGQQHDSLGTIESLTDQAASALETFNLTNLAKWIKREAIPQLDSRLSYERYKALANDLHVKRAEFEAQQ
jgi:hypothetical protein